MAGPKLVIFCVMVAGVATAGYKMYEESTAEVTPENARGVIHYYTAPSCAACRSLPPR